MQLLYTQLQLKSIVCSLFMMLIIPMMMMMMMHFLLHHKVDFQSQPLTAYNVNGIQRLAEILVPTLIL